MWRSLARTVLDALAPRRCAVCLRVADAAVCGACVEALAGAPQPRRRVLAHGVAAAAYVFEGPVRTVLHRGKYRGDRAALRVLAATAAPRLVAVLPRPAAMVSVPLGARRLRRRGYNQADEIARVLSDAFGCRVVAGLERVRDTAPQADRDEAARRRNVAGAFEWHGTELAGAHLWLVDDVLTTGATTGAAAGALLAAGAARVDVAVVATVV